jgi:hypothetical protein
LPGIQRPTGSKNPGYEKRMKAPTGDRQISQIENG